MTFNRLFCVLTLILMILPRAVFANSETEFDFNPNNLISDSEMLDSQRMSLLDIKHFLLRGSLSDLVTKDNKGLKRSAAEIIWNASREFGLNPRFILTMLQKEQGIVEDDRATKDQLDWAMGYGICDDCSKSDPRLSKFKGFGNQVYFAAKRINESFLSDLSSRGFTETGIGPGIEVVIDGVSIVPVNFATASLYSYTPHLIGNINFVKIWQSWFDYEYPNGTLLQDKNSGAVWLIQAGLRRPITSRAAFASRFNDSQIIQVFESELNRFEIGTPISFPNYSLLRSPRGTVYLIVNDTRRGFDSKEALREVGLSQDEIIDVTWSDLSAYVEGEPITIDSVYPQGVLLQDKATGGVYFVKDRIKYPIPSREVLDNQFRGLQIVPVSQEVLNQYERSYPVGFKDGTLVGVKGEPDVYIIENGTRRPISDEITFYSFGWNWNQVIWTDKRSVLAHKLGNELSAGLANITIANN